MLFAAVDFVMLLPFALFAAFAIGAWVVFDMFFNKRSRTDELLDRLRNPNAPGADKKEGGFSKDGITKMLEKASPALSKPFQPKNEKEAGMLTERLTTAGFRSEHAVKVYLTLKTICCLIGLMMGGGIALILGGFTLGSLLKAGVAVLIGFFIPDMILMFLGKGRKQKIFLGLPDALDLMVVCVEAGLGLDQAMRKVSEEMSTTNPVLASEFKTSNQQLQMGQGREQVLNELGSRCGVDDLKALASIIIQADKFGSSIAKALRVQSESMRVRRRQIAEEKAAKTAVKLIFPLVIFIFPGIFVVLVGPAAITMVNEMLPAFQK